jgi:transposase
VSAKSRVAERLGWFVRRRDGLIVFRDDGRIEMDLSLVQNAIRPLTLTRSEEDRKSVQRTLFLTNALFAGRHTGGHGWARTAALIVTATLNGVEPFAWLTATLEAIAHGHRARRIDELRPRNFLPRSS